MKRLVWLRPGARVIGDREFFCAIEAITRGLAEAFGPGQADKIVAQVTRPTNVAGLPPSPQPPAIAPDALPANREDTPLPRGLRHLIWVACDNLRNRLSALRVLKRLIDIEVRLDNQDEAWGTWREANDSAGRHGLRVLDGGRS